MSKQELCYVKQAVRFTKDWDVYQIILRQVFKMIVNEGKTQVFLTKLMVMLFAVSCFLVSFSLEIQAMTRTLKTQPVIVLAAFGTTTKANVTYDFFEKQLKDELPENFKQLEVRWAFTSEIVRERANKKFHEAGIQKRYRSLVQVLADLDDEGYRKVIVQPLHIFPGQEYEGVKKVVKAFELIGLNIRLGGTLLHEWSSVFETVGQLQSEFLGADEGCTILVAHGTPKTFPGSNATYLGLDRYVSSTYPNVFVGGVEGVLTRSQAIGKVKQCTTKRVRLVPFMYVAGDHIMNDIMGIEPADGKLSWAMELKDAGLVVDSVQLNYMEEPIFKGLGFYPGINSIFIRQIVENLNDLTF